MMGHELSVKMDVDYVIYVRFFRSVYHQIVTFSVGVTVDEMCTRGRSLDCLMLRNPMVAQESIRVSRCMDETAPGLCRRYV